MKKFIPGLMIVVALCACQEDKIKSQSPQSMQLEFLTPTVGTDCEGDCGPPIVFDGCYMFEYSETIALIRLNGLIGSRETEGDTCYPEAGFLWNGVLEVGISNYIHVAGREVDVNSDVLYVSNFCNVQPIDWVSDQMVLVSLSGEGENHYVTNCISVREQEVFASPEMSNIRVELPSGVDDLKSYLDHYYDKFDTLCLPRIYSQDEQQQFFERMLACSTFHPFPSESEPDLCADARSEEEREACLARLEE